MYMHIPKRNSNNHLPIQRKIRLAADAGKTDVVYEDKASFGKAHMKNIKSIYSEKTLQARVVEYVDGMVTDNILHQFDNIGALENNVENYIKGRAKPGTKLHRLLAEDNSNKTIFIAGKEYLKRDMQTNNLLTLASQALENHYLKMMCQKFLTKEEKDIKNVLIKIINGMENSANYFYDDTAFIEEITYQIISNHKEQYSLEESKKRDGNSDAMDVPSQKFNLTRHHIMPAARMFYLLGNDKAMKEHEKQYTNFINFGLSEKDFEWQPANIVVGPTNNIEGAKGIRRTYDPGNGIDHEAHDIRQGQTKPEEYGYPETEEKHMRTNALQVLYKGLIRFIKRFENLPAKDEDKAKGEKWIVNTFLDNFFKVSKSIFFGG